MYKVNLLLISLYFFLNFACKPHIIWAVYLSVNEAYDRTIKREESMSARWKLLEHERIPELASHEESLRKGFLTYKRPSSASPDRSENPPQHEPGHRMECV